MDGDRVEIRAQATLYEPRGDYQLLVDVMRRGGQGAFYEEFLRLKSKLEAEGLFSNERKHKIPRFPLRLGIVTSLQAAALHDVLKTLAIRWPCCSIVIYPASVQGSDAAPMLRQILSTAISRNECEIILLVRGGGSLEDLYPFNDEMLARTIDASPIPIITGIGHETDFSIADFVADARAATPTAAAQLAVPDKQETNLQLNHLLSRSNKTMTRLMQQRMQRLDELSRRVLHPGISVSNTKNHVSQLKRRLELCHWNYLSYKKQILERGIVNIISLRPKLESRRNKIENHLVAMKTNLNKSQEKRKVEIIGCISSLQQLNPDNILSRGYCLAFDEKDKVIKHIQEIRSGNKVKIRLKSGQFDATVGNVMP